MTDFLVKDPQIEAEIASQIHNVFKVAQQAAPITTATSRASTWAQATPPETALKPTQFKSTVQG